MLQVGKSAPDFELPILRDSSAAPETFRRASDQGRWLLLIYYPRDFSFICPTELIAFSNQASDFSELDCDLLGVSIDTLEDHRRWLESDSQSGGVGKLSFPLACDHEGRLAKELGIWNETTELPNRALVLIDPDGLVQYYVVHSLRVGRSVEESLRVLQALRTGELCPASWTDGDGTLDAEQLLNSGRVLGHYRIQETLGSGTFGTVFSAWDLRLERAVALKVLRRPRDQWRSELLNEARTVAGIEHPSICTIYSVEELDHLPVIVMQYVDGSSLAEIIAAEPLAQDPARVMTRRIAEGLSVAHDHNVVHGDLKPANILIQRDQSPVIVDFGLTASHRVKLSSIVPRNDGQVDTHLGALEATLNWERANDESNDGSTSPSTDRTAMPDQTVSWYGSTARLFGTPAYMSPEQARGGMPSPSSDVFSLGLIYAEMLSGQRVLFEKELGAMLHSLQTDNLAHRVLQQMGNDFPKPCLAMLHPDPADRPTIRQVVAALGGH